MNPAAQYLVPLVTAAMVSALGWLVAFMPEPAHSFYIFLGRRQRTHFVQFCRFTGRMFGMVFAAWMVVFSILIMGDLLR